MCNNTPWRPTGVPLAIGRVRGEVVPCTLFFFIVGRQVHVPGSTPSIPSLYPTARLGNHIRVQRGMQECIISICTVIPSRGVCIILRHPIPQTISKDISQNVLKVSSRNRYLRLTPQTPISDAFPATLSPFSVIMIARTSTPPSTVPQTYSPFPRTLLAGFLQRCLHDKLPPARLLRPS